MLSDPGCVGRWIERKGGAATELAGRKFCQDLQDLLDHKDLLAQMVLLDLLDQLDLQGTEDNLGKMVPQVCMQTQVSL